MGKVRRCGEVDTLDCVIDELDGAALVGLAGNCIFIERGIPMGAEAGGACTGTDLSGGCGLGEGDGDGSGRRVGEALRGMLLGKDDVTDDADGRLEVLAKLLVGIMCDRDEDDEWLYG